MNNLGVLARMRRHSVPLLLTCAAVLPLLAAAEAMGLRSAQAPPAVTADTTVLFGPRQFNATSSGALYVEQFTTTVDHSAKYVLEVTNGAASGTNRVTNGQVKLNGTTVVSATELQNGGRVITPLVWLADGANTLQVQATGSGTRYLSVRVLRIIPEKLPLYRHGFRKTASTYTVFHDTFATPRGQPMPGRLYVEQGSAADSVFLNGQRVYPACVPTLQNSCAAVVDPYYDVGLQAVNALRVEMGGAAGTAVVVRVEAVDTMAPVIALTGPAEALVTREGTVTVAGTVTDDTPPVLLTIDGDTVPVDGGTGAFSHVVALAHDGTHAIQVAARDAASPVDEEVVIGADPAENQGNAAQLVRTVIRDSQPPALALSAPADGAVVDAATVLVQGSVTDATALTVNVNGIPVTPGAAGAFAVEVALAEGANFVTATATDAAGNASTVTRQVTRSAPPLLTVAAPLDGTVTQAASVDVQGTATGAAPLSLTLNGSPVALAADGAFSQTVALAVGANVLTLVATDGAGRTATSTRSVTREQDVELPPDPATVAPALERGVATDFAASNAFLYTGSDPIQTGVAPGTIEPRRVGVLRGRVLTREGNPLSGVRVSVLGHPELGQTLSRADGMFDLAANGGGELVLNYEKAGVLPAQRPVRVGWQRFSNVDDVRLVPLDTAVTQVDFSQPAQVARGSVVADGDGPRRATLVFRQGTSASLEMPDGTLVPAPSLSIRATEYTVGPNGREAMPGPLPPTVAYTYAVELSADEAIAAGAAHVRFDRPVSIYVDNFLEFPAGTAVPAAWFDRTRGVWVPQDDGRVVAVLSVDGGTAAVDVNGDGAAEGPDALAAWGFDAAELARLAALYAPGTTLWRMQTPHFSALDFNFPAGPDGPDPAPPPGAGPDRNGKDKTCPSKTPGSIIECETRVLGERVAVAGTPYHLEYRSSRVPGRAGARQIDLPLTGEEVPANLHGIRVEIDIAGRRFVQTYTDLQPHLVHRFEWDGRDAYGREVQGGQVARVRRAYRYRTRYYMATMDSVRLRSFGMVCDGTELSNRLSCFVGADVPIDSVRRRLDQVDERDWVHDPSGAPPTGTWDARAMGLGGWTLDVHHAYDPRGQTLYYGDGTTVPAVMRNGQVRNVAGRRANCPRSAEPVCGDGGPALEAWLEWVDGMAFGPDGSLYLADWASYKLRRLRPDGVLEAFAGTGVRGHAGMGGPAAQAQLAAPYDVDVAPDGSVYFADTYNSRVYRVAPSGIIDVFAGNGSWDGSARSGDDGPATGAPMDPVASAVGPDGSVYIVDNDNHRIRRVTPDGTIHTVAGTGVCGETGDGGPAAQARLCYPTDVAFGPDGSMYISDSPRIRKVSPDGMMSTVAGFLNSPDCFDLFYDQDDPMCGEGEPATEIPMYGVSDLHVGPDGLLYFAQKGLDVVRRIEPDGTVRTLVGIGTFTPGIWCDFYNGRVTGDPDCGDGAGARQIELYNPTSVLTGADGRLYVNDTYNNLVRSVGPALESFSDDRFYIPSPSGAQVFVFNAAGRHLETRDAQSGRLALAFGYDAGGLLATVTDAEGRVTRVERSAQGAPLALVGPYGERMSLVLDANGWLAGISDPARQSLGMTYTPDGLLTSLTDARGNTSEFDYVGGGSLWVDSDAGGGFKRLERFDQNCLVASGGYLYGRQPAQGDSIVSCTHGSGTRVTTAEGRSTVYWAQDADGGRAVREMITPDGARRVTEDDPGGATVAREANGTTRVSAYRRDPRWGMAAAILDSVRTTLPSGLASTTRMSRRVTLSDSTNPLVLATRTDSVSVNGRVFTEAYDAALRQTTARTPEGRTAVVLADSMDRPVEARFPGRLPVVRAYDGLGRLSTVTQGSRMWRYTYDGGGRVATVTDPLQRVTAFGYDSVGRMVSETLPDGRQMHFGFDSAGNVTSIAPPERTAHRFEYTAVGQRDAYAPPAPGAGTWQTRYRYNRDRDLVQVIRPDSQVVDLGYTAGGQLSTVTTPDGQVRYGYAPGTGLLTSIAVDSTAVSFTHDGGLPTSAQWTGSVSGRVDLAYGANLWITSQSVNGGHAVDFRYDADGLLTGVGALNLQRSAATGVVTASTLGGVTRSVGYDAYGELAADTVRHGGGVLFARAYTRDALGRISAMTEQVAGGATAAYGFAYDSIGRLVGVTRDGVAVEAYEYDANGNRLRAVTAGGVAQGAVDAQDRLLSYGGATYGYSANGELQARVVGSDTTRYRYDALGNLREVRLPGGGTIQYVADPVNRRVGRRVNGVLVQGFLYQDQLNPVAELDGAGAVVSRFVYGERGNVPEYMVKGGRTYRLVSDHLGSVRLVVDAETGAVAQRMEYDSWGNVTLDSNPGFQPFGFAGGLYDPQTGLTRFGARDYEARTGRWTAKDPIGFAGGSSNLYAYAIEDPVNMHDPTGHQGIPGAIVGLVAGGFGAYATGGDAISVISGAIAGGIVGLASAPQSWYAGAALGGVTNLMGRAIGISFKCTTASSMGNLGNYNFGAAAGGAIGGALGVGLAPMVSGPVTNLAEAALANTLRYPTLPQRAGEVASGLANGLLGSASEAAFQSLAHPGVKCDEDKPCP
jgi:RHS repeat-associated protein